MIGLSSVMPIFAAQKNITLTQKERRDLINFLANHSIETNNQAACVDSLSSLFRQTKDFFCFSFIKRSPKDAARKD